MLFNENYIKFIPHNYVKLTTNMSHYISVYFFSMEETVTLIFSHPVREKNFYDQPESFSHPLTHSSLSGVALFPICFRILNTNLE